MNVTQAITERRSIRAFRPDAVDRDTLTEILQAAVRTPSWGNSQPWEVFIASGNTLGRIRAAFLENYKNAIKISAEIERPHDWPQSAKNRQMHLRPDMVSHCGEGADEFGPLNQAIFNAPCVIYLCLDKIYEHWGLYDLGAYSQSIMLLAQERGLSTIPAIMAVAYPGVIRKELNIPENLKIAIGIAIGYKDAEHKINNFNSSRSPLSETVRFYD